MAYNRLLNKSYIIVFLIYLVFGINLIFADQKKSSDMKFYGRLWVQYDNSDSSISSNNKVSSIRDNEGMGRFGVKGKSLIGNGYALNYKVCLLYTSDAADDSLRVNLGGRRIIKKIFFSSRRRHTRFMSVSWARRCV